MILGYKLFEEYDGKQFAIIVENEKEYNILMEALEFQHKYVWADGVRPASKSYRETTMGCIYISNENTLTYSSKEWWVVNMKHNLKTYTVDKYLKKFPYKRKNKIKNAEVDPFDEENWGYIQEQIELDDFGKEIKPEKKRVYSKPLKDKDLIYDVDYWVQLAVEGWLTENQGKGFWVKNRMVSNDDVFETPQLDATDVVWYGKKLRRPIINKTNDFNVREFGIKEQKELDEWDPFGEEFGEINREYNIPIQKRVGFQPGRAVIYDLNQWNNLYREGWIIEDDGDGYWVKNGMRSLDDVFETPQLDATHVAWYNK